MLLGKLAFSDFHHFAAIAANVNTYHFLLGKGDLLFSYFIVLVANVLFYFAPYMLGFVGVLSSLPILRSRNFWRHSSSNVQSLAYINPIPLFYKKILTGMDFAIRNENITILYFYCLHLICRYMVVVASRWLLNFFF